LAFFCFDLNQITDEAAKLLVENYRKLRFSDGKFSFLNITTSGFVFHLKLTAWI
jgi:hypothetical protein